MLRPIWHVFGTIKLDPGRTALEKSSTSARQRKTADTNLVITDDHNSASGKVIYDRWKVRLDDLELIGGAATGESSDKKHRKACGVRTGEEAVEVCIGRDEDPVLPRAGSKTTLSLAASKPMSRMRTAS